VGAVHESLEGIAALSDEIDPDLAAVFIEEADELLPRIGEALRGWAAQPADPSLPASLMRLLHTVKGSARMAGAMRVGQLVHDMETRIESASALPRVPVALIDELIARCDQVLALYEVVRDPGSASAQAAARSVIDALTGQAGAAIGLAGGAVTDAQPSSSAGGGRGVPSGPSDPGASARPTAQPLIRVRADLLDRLVNEAGEVSIARARLDNALGGIRQSLSELTENVNRLRTQLREIELAADSQIQARNARNREEQHFDPLEFDRYTRFQELTRMLAESVSDVATVQQNALRHLDEGARDLGRQGQVTRDLQQDLMRIRMVPFGSVADRLYRVVRQAAKETDKRVSLDLKGATAELDRSVLERMVGPIEHLLRNAVVHGIEPRSGRLAAGKAETGELTLDVRQEANEVILSFADDGAGLNYPRIRARALERGLIDADAVLGERELAQLIFTPGFSTATEVTTLAGRGVGMDVVRAEVAAMGGRIDLQSTPGAGTRFTVYLPVSLAVTQVVLLTVGEVRIAVASALIEQVLQMQPEALAGAYARHQTEWQGEQVPLYFLGSVLELSGCTPLAQRYSPVVMLRSGHQRIALHVDHVAPSQEVVVKHVGPQLARLTGMAGATVLGNGEIVLILNPVQIVAAGRGAQAGQGDTASFAPTRIEIVPTVMVVDDSVTVRKVTQRLLVREGYQVILAKDGVDALRQLQDAVPDVMLLDVEMPRMDGFDLTRNIRGDERLRGIPIVMITSRTAEKHRSHALSLGVDVFLGKPYDEAEMLAHVKALAARRQHAAG
jgi:chemosensory pili system protein ChpA (sensor histidine kinase/response regulator)